MFKDIAMTSSHPAIQPSRPVSSHLATRDSTTTMADYCSDSSNSSSLSSVTDAESSRGGEEECEWNSSSVYSSSNDDDSESEADMNMYSSDETSSSFNSGDSSDEISISSDSECDTDDSETSLTDPAELNHDEYECRLSSMKEFHTPLYDDAELSVLDSHLLMYQYALRHCITTQAFTELISLVETHMPRNSRAVSSLYKLRKFFEENFNDTKCQAYEYCSKCHRLIDLERTGEVGCSSGCEGATINTFVYVPVEAQLKKKLEGTLY